MLLRQIFPRAAPTPALVGVVRSFSSTRPLRDDVTGHGHGEDKRTHYEVLKVPPNATPAQIKKSFYALSKHHHPDANPSDPDASKRFVRLSEAYSILSTPAKRAAYDRTLPSHSPQHHRQGSYHSTGPAGGRPASGLSHRRPRTNSSRGSFRGPPPSFYAQGGWGTHSEKRKAAHDESTGWWEEAAARNRSAGGMGPRQDPYKDRAGDVPHFDSVAHEQRGRREDERRARRMAGQEEDRTTGDGYSPFSMFLVVSGVLVTALMAPLLFVVASPSRKEPRNGKPRPSPPST